MISKIKSFFRLLRDKKIGSIFNKLFKPVRKSLYLFRAWLEDLYLGGVSVGKRIPSKYVEEGAFATESTDYRLLDRVFKSYPLKKTDILVDVGCGEGRVLTYLYLRGFRNKLIGIEIDPNVADVARKRTKKCSNIDIVCSNILDCSKIISTANVFYLFNPFDQQVIARFIDMIEEHCTDVVTVYYVFDNYAKKYLDKREKWKILRRDMVHRPEKISVPYSIYRYIPK